MSHHADLLSPLFSPRSMAIVGVSRHPEKLGHLLLQNALSGGFAGAIHLVNPHGGELLGEPLRPNLAACPRGVELVVLALPASQVLAQAKQAVARNCAAILVISDGFSDRDEEGAAWERALGQLCQERGVALLGPNSLGIIHRQQGVNASLTRTLPPIGGVSLLSRSGTLCAAAMEWLASRQLGMAKMISLGNQAGVTDAQCMSHLAHDPDTQVIACHLEWISEGRAFLKAATEASQSKPVVMLLGGGSAWYERPATHQAGYRMHSPTLFHAACDRTGMLQTTYFQEWLDAVLALARSPLPGNNRVAIITNGSGPGTLTADMLDQQGLRHAALAAPLIATLQPQLAPGSSLHGPLDLGGAARPEQLLAAVETVARDDGVDALLVVLAPHPLTTPLELVSTLHRSRTDQKPLLTVLMGGDPMQPAVAALDRMALPCYPTPERAVIALVTLDRYSQWRRRPPRVIPAFSVNQGRVRRLIQRCSALGMHQLPDLESKGILHAYGIAIPEGDAAGTVNEALEIAERVGYPIALHLLSPDLHRVHDMEIRHVNMASPQALRDGFDLLTLRFANRLPSGRLEGVFVEKVLSHGRHLLMGMQRDRQFGPLLHAGRAHSPSLEDAACQLAPITGEEALAMLRSGCYQHPLHDLHDALNHDELQGVAELLQRIGQLAMDFPEINRIQINPLMVRRAGLPPVATECTIQLDLQENRP
ncbi:MAG: acetate--CoA ligase family protein [Magnetococcales bacterium]|nr:acetate--CoA ligase family protein [Magnetococcales bacterium]